MAAGALVVGLPSNDDGTPHELTALCRRFANRLKGRFNLPTILVDERYTSLSASAQLNEQGVHGRKQKTLIDQYAAQQILQAYFDEPAAGLHRMNNPQLNKNGELQHLLTTEGLPARIVRDILDRAATFLDAAEGREIKKVPLLHGKSVFNVFFENSTRTRTTFEIAAKRLSADVVNLNIGSSSTSKGETLLDTVDNLCAMHADMFVVRHSQSGAAHFIARHVAPEVHVINAGDGRHAHPTQALLDMFTIRHYKKEFHNLRVAIVGDVLHSRVARSQIHALTTLGVPEVRVIAPKTLLPTMVENLGVRVYHDMEQGLKDVDVVMMLRLQNERMQGALLPFGAGIFQVLRPDAGEAGAGKTRRHRDASGTDEPRRRDRLQRGRRARSVILSQVTFGIAVRMAVMSMLAGANSMNIHIKNGRLIDPKNKIRRAAGCVHRGGQGRGSRQRTDGFFRRPGD